MTRYRVIRLARFNFLSLGRTAARSFLVLSEFFVFAKNHIFETINMNDYLQNTHIRPGKKNYILKISYVHEYKKRKMGLSCSREVERSPVPLCMTVRIRKVGGMCSTLSRTIKSLVDIR